MAKEPDFKYAPMFQLGKDTTEYRLLSKEGVSVGEFEGKRILKVSKEALTLLAQQAFHDCEFMLRRAHNEQVAKILTDPEASENDKYVALQFLRNAETSVKGVLPFCQDTGTAIIHGEKGQQVWTGFEDEEALSLGVYNTYTQDNLRYSQNAPLNMYDEVLLLPHDQGHHPERGHAPAVPGGEDEEPRHGSLPALPHLLRHRWHVCREEPSHRQARQHQVL